MATALQATRLIRHAPSYVADAFVGSRPDPGRHFAFDMLPADTNDEKIIEGAYPA